MNLRSQPVEHHDFLTVRGMSRRRLLSSALALVPAALAAGCTGDAEDGRGGDDPFRLPTPSRSAGQHAAGWPVRVKSDSSPPVLAGDTLYCAEYGGQIRAFDGITGREKWRVPPTDELVGLDDVVQDTPLVADGVVVVGRSSASPQASAVVALDADQGSELWSVSVSGGLKVVRQGRQVIYAENLPRKEGQFRSGSTIRAVDFETGEILWKHRSPSVSHLFADEVAVYAVYSGGEDRGVRALRLKDGQEVWRRTTAVTDPSAVRLAGGVIVAAHSDPEGSVALIKALRASSGEVAWQHEYHTFTAAPVMGGEGRVLVSPDRTVQALDAKTGVRIWSYRSSNDTLYSLLEHDGIVICGEYEQPSPKAKATGIRINLLDGRKGKRKASWEGDYAGAEILLAAYGLAYVRLYVEEGMELVCLDIGSGKQLWKSPAEGGAILAAGHRALYVFGAELDRLNPRTGKRLDD